jgi:DNA invertase Pin-like site-specific DNA recombinase
MKAKKNKAGSSAPNTTDLPRLNASWVRHPIRMLLGVALRVLIYARYSTDEQNPRSIDAQVAYCRRFLEALGVKEFTIEVMRDEGISGEQIWRPGINQVSAGIENKRWNLILVEDSSRLFRDPQPCIQLVRAAVDHDIRTICINDFIDTEEKDRWEDDLYEAQRHHAQTNRFTRRRIIRAQEDRWENNAAMGPLRSGYKRTPTHPATQHEPERGPFYDTIDKQWAPIVRLAFEQIAAGQPTWMVGRFLRENKLPGINGDPNCDWTDREVIALIQCELYRGIDIFRKTVSRKNHGTGKRAQKRAAQEEMWEREMPHLKITPDWLWFKANDVIVKRTRGKDRPRGDDHPLAGIPRNSRGPLSKVFFCGCKDCHHKMYQDGRNEGGYRCGAASKTGCCWNKATALRDDVHHHLKVAISDKLTALNHEFQTIVDGLHGLFCKDLDSQQQRLSELAQNERQLDNACESLSEAIEIAKQTQEPLPRLVKRLIKREAKLARVRAELERLRDPNQGLVIPTVADLRAARDRLVNVIANMDRAAGEALQRFTGHIYAVPHQQFATNKVVLRARFELNLRALLSPSVSLRLDICNKADVDAVFPDIPMLVDLFKPSIGPKHGLAALALYEAGKKLPEIGLLLGYEPNKAKRDANIAVQYGRMLRDAGLTDAFQELLEPPPAASRWRMHKRFLHHSETKSPNGEAA